MVLTLGILGIAINILGIIGAIAWYLASQDLPEMDAGQMDLSGRAMTQAGKVCGIVGFVLGLVGCCFTAIWFAVFFGVMGPRMGF
jgi:hypothetical protein